MTKLDQIRALREDRAKRRTTTSKRSIATAPANATVQLPPPTQAPAKRKPRAAKPAKPKARKVVLPKPKVGRPKAEDRGKTLSDLKPWMAAKVSRATWYRSRAK